MPKYWSHKAGAITPYVAGEQPRIADIIKLNTNENPFPPSPRVLRELRAFNAEHLRLYPAPDGGAFREAAAKLHGVNPESVYCANGSDEALAIAFQAFFDEDSALKIPDISYSFYPVWADLYGIPYETVPLNADFSVPVEKIMGGSVVIPNPNAPTGLALGADKIERIVAGSKGVVLIDEAYQMFGSQSVIPLTEKYDNLLVVRTLSKSHSLAGLRVGYVVGDKNLIRAMDCVKDSFNSYPTDMLAQRLAAAALSDTDYTDKNCRRIVEIREKTSTRLRELGFSLPESKANFVFCTHEKMSAERIMAHLRERGIIVRRFKKERIDNYLRITIGTEEQMETLFRALEALLK